MARLALGISRVTSRITRESRELGFAAVYLGDQMLHAGVRELAEKEDYDDAGGGEHGGLFHR